MSNRTAAARTAAANSPKSRHLRLVRNIPTFTAVPCLPGCDYADLRDSDLAEPYDSGHRCSVNVGVVETRELVADEVQMVAVDVIRYAYADGTVTEPRIEVEGVAARALEGFYASPRAAVELASLLSRAAELLDTLTRRSA